MRRVWNVLLCLALVLSVLAVALYLFPGPAARLGLDFWTLPANVGSIGQEGQREGELGAECQAAWRRNEAKNKVAREAAEGRLTLLEAAARFRDLDVDTPAETLAAWRRAVGGATDDERYCRTVIQYVEVLLRDRPEESAAALRDLGAQLAEALSRGDIRLPG
jgi:hypothetical protein